MSGWGEVVTGHSGKGGRTTHSTGNLMYKAVARLEGGLDPWVIRLSLQAEGFKLRNAPALLFSH